MKLFEATNGFTGESYIRVYVWCENEKQALFMARAMFEREGLKRAGLATIYFSTIKIRALFDGLDTPFVTAPSDSGFEFEGMISEPFKVQC